ncbi:Gef64C [Drosophila busckii]|uniref:Gef64C n=1 Tax=Drosophila busckii TaxID=30019 RepID=A0A0M4EY65_DROBS|nr:Gef64C [Drosophila busckii]
MYDKSKKSWSQRLKLSSDSKHATIATVAGMQAMQLQQLQQQQQHHQQQHQQHLLQQHHHHHLQHLAYQLPPPPAAPPPGYEFLPSALSRSMKYAEPWIYGTVRGIPARHSYGYGHPHAAAIFAAENGGEHQGQATALAIVICSCVEYLNGTKRDVKKASVCKKCKGSRLPLATIGAGGTLRLPAPAAASAATSLRQRPMAATMRVVSASKKSRPTILDPQKDPYDLMRRTRLLSPEPSAESSTTAGAKDAKSRPAANTASNMQRGRSRTRAPAPAPAVKQPSSKAATPTPEPADCWLMEDNESLLQCSGLVSSSSGSNSRRSILRCNVNPYELISVESAKQTTAKAKAKAKATNDDDDFDVADAQLAEDEPLEDASAFYNNNKVAAIAGQRISLGREEQQHSELTDSSDNYERIVIAVETATPTPATATAKPMPRSKKCIEPLNLTPATATVAAVDGAATVVADYTMLTVTPTTPSIKSILKRPTTLELPAANLPIADNAATTATAATPLTPSGNSQFYIPTPTASAVSTPTSGLGSARKKVQFMVEDKIIAIAAAATATTDDSDDVAAVTEETTTAAVTANYEYYERKRNAAAQQELAQQQQQEQQQLPTLLALATDVDDEHNFTASVPAAETTTTTTTTLSTHYEDVLPTVHQIFDNSNGSSSSSNSATDVSQVAAISANSIAADAASAKLLLSPLSSSTTTTAAATAAAAAASAQKTTAANRDYDDDDEHNESSSSNSNSNNDGDDDKEQQQQQTEDKKQQQQQLEDETKVSGKTQMKELELEQRAKPRASQKRAAQATQSRNPIRRAHSERHLSASETTRPLPGQPQLKRSEKRQEDEESPQTVILNFKDTMALRIKSNRNDSRDLFQKRPTEPPPPPPATAAATATAKQAAATTNGLAEQPKPQQINKSSQQQQQQQRTVVRVAPFNKSSEVHRLKISHSEATAAELQSEHNVVLRCASDRRREEQDVAPKKTSILINGDDCYSTMNLSADAAQPLYQSSVVVNSQSSTSVCINVSGSAEERAHNLLNSQLGAIIPIRSSEPNGVNLQRSASCNSSSSSNSTASSNSSSGRARTLIRLDFDGKQQTGSSKLTSSTPINTPSISATPATPCASPTPPLVAHESELLKILRNPVEAVKLNLVPHVCALAKPPLESSFIAKLLLDPMLAQLADGLETDTVAELIEHSLQRLQQTRQGVDMSGTKDHDDMNRLINVSLQRVRLERHSSTKEEDRLSQRGSISSANSFASAHNYELFDFEANANESDCYQSCSSELTAAGTIEEEQQVKPAETDAGTRAKFYQLLVDATLAEIEQSAHVEAEHHYESIRHNGDPIYEEINEVPPPLPLTAPPLNDAELDKKSARSIFEGASKYDILSYLVDAKERGLAREESFDYSNNPKIIEEEASDTLSELDKRVSCISDEGHSNMHSLSPPPHNFICGKSGSDVERQDSGVGSETSKSSRSKYQPAVSPLHLCEDCDGAVETQLSETGVLFAPLVCRKCGKKRVERKEIITEIVETEEKYGRDLQIILEEFCHPMLVAGLLTQEQLSAIFLNTEDLLENNQTLAERMRDALDIALEQGDDDLLTVNIGRIFLDFTQMLHAFESYCVRQAGASLLLANLEKEKELLRIFLKVSQMENAVLRRMNLNSFLMVPVQRVTKYPLLLARLYKVTPAHLDGRELLKQAQEKIELHLNHINQEAKDVPTKLWRRISSSSPNRRASCEIDMINIKLRKMAIDILEWNHDEVRFAMEGKLLLTQPTDSNWKKARTIKLTPVNALLVTNGKPSANYRAEKAMSDKLNFPKHTGIREASLLLVKEKCGRYTLIREPLYLDRCVVCSEADWDDYFEVQEISSKDTFIFKAEDGVRTKQWYTQLQYHAQGMGAWRKRRNALANIMINGMLTRS